MPAHREPRPTPKCPICGDWGTILDRHTGQEKRCPENCAASKKIRRC
ncbi:hypothetical protein P3T35_003060 [Kitasatospora sp. GP30]|nr:hypothetical protein [Kitasatospora sp. GP30]MDH6141047.1 hypothetical protein [Kitasatospora sp. GP30]